MNGAAVNSVRGLVVKQFIVDSFVHATTAAYSAAIAVAPRTPYCKIWRDAFRSLSLTSVPDFHDSY